MSIDMIIRIAFVVFLVLLCYAILLLLFTNITSFKQDLDYINSEIGRTMGREQRYWKRRKRKLWRALFLFSRRF